MFSKLCIIININRIILQYEQNMYNKCEMDKLPKSVTGRRGRSRLRWEDSVTLDLGMAGMNSHK